MEILQALTSVFFAGWCVSELTISLLSFRNRSRDLSAGADRFSHLVVWFSTLPPVLLAYLLHLSSVFPTALENFSTRLPGLGYLGCVFIALGITIRVLAVATLKQHFTVQVAIVEKHELIETGLYQYLRHPAYLGHLVSLLGLGLAWGNWVGLAALVILPLAGILCRIRVEERALLRHFGAAYQVYAKRTKRLLPGLW